MKGRRQLQKNWIRFSEKYDNTHFMIYFTCVQMFARRFLKNFLTSSQQMCKTQTGEHLLCRFLLLFSPHVPSSPSFFVLRMVLNECTYTHPHVPSLFFDVAVCKFKWAVERGYLFQFCDFESRVNIWWKESIMFIHSLSWSAFWDYRDIFKTRSKR